MSLWDDLQRGVRSVADAVSKEAGKVSLSTQVSEVERQIWQIYSQMGYRALELLRAGALADEKLSEFSAQIDPLQAKLEALKAQMQAAEGPPAGESPTEPQPS
jgi:hypothetical protein